MAGGFHVLPTPHADGTVEPFMSWLTHNQTVQAIATICTLLGGAVLLYAALRYVFRFCRDVYHTSFKTALKRWRKRAKQLVYLASNDLHIFVGTIVYFGCLAAAGVLVPLLVSSLSLSYAPFLATAVGGAISTFILYGVFFAGLLVWLSLAVIRRRIRKLSRSRRLKRWKAQRATAHIHSA